MIRFYNGSVIRFDGGAHITKDEVHVEGGSIVYVGPEKRDGSRFEREINLNGNILMPGFKNGHTHTPMTFLRSLADDLPLDRWLRESIWPNEAKLTDEAVYNFTKLGILEYVSGGTTAVFDMYNHTDYYAQACIDSGFRTVICGAMNDFDRDPTQIERDYLKWRSSGLVGYILGIHAEYTTGIERLNYMVSLAEKYKSPCWTHMAETKKETDDCRLRTGMSPVKYLDSLGFFKYGGGGYHCVWFDDEDIGIFAKKGLGVVTNPSSNLKLASGVAPVKKMLDAGIKISIGTDSAASNNALDMFREMYLTLALQSWTECDPIAVKAEDVLKMACVNGAECMGLYDCNDIAEGKKADLVVLDMSRPSMQPANNPVRNTVYAGSRDIVKMTMVNGKILYEDGEFYIGEDPAEIYSKSEDFMKRVIY